MLAGVRRELVKRTESGRDLALADHVCDFDALECCRSLRKGLESEHWADPLLDRPVILLDHVFQMFDPDHLDRDRAAEALQRPVDRTDPSCVGPASVDYDLPG